jgi:hypothetical protein
LLDLPRLTAELCGLERRTARGGKDSIDHAPGAHDDTANSVAGAALLAIGARPQMVITAEILAQSRIPSRWALNRRGSPSLGGFDVYSAALRHGPRQP